MVDAGWTEQDAMDLCYARVVEDRDLRMLKALGFKNVIQVGQWIDPCTYIKDGVEMKFDYIIQNPPYDGLKKLYQKITENAFLSLKDSGKLISLMPTQQVEAARKVNNSLLPSIYKTCNSYNIIDPSSFGLQFNTGVGIFVFGSSGPYLQDIQFTGWSDMKKELFYRLCVHAGDTLSSHVVYHDVRLGKPCTRKAQFYQLLHCMGTGLSKTGGKPKSWPSFYAAKNRQPVTEVPSQNLRYFIVPLDSVETSNKLIAYLDSNIIRWCLLQVKTNHCHDSGVYGYIPWIDSLDVNDLIKQYNITDEELALIEQEMKPFN